MGFDSIEVRTDRPGRRPESGPAVIVDECVDIGGDESVAGGTAGVLSDSSGVVGVSDGWVVLF